MKNKFKKAFKPIYKLVKHGAMTKWQGSLQKRRWAKLKGKHKRRR